jgi:exoribonuclease-2
MSLYAEIDPLRFEVLGTSTRLERIRIDANLRHDRLDAVITEATIANSAFDAPFASELTLLWRFSRSLLAAREAVRGRPEPLSRVDISFELDGEGESARVRLKQRRRGAPLDLLVAELMIFANRTWGRWLADRGATGVYRSQSLGRVRMSTTPAPHEGMGVSHYAWSSSPLRRYVDLVNQRQLIACIRNESPPYAANDADLFAIVSAFDAAYGAYAAFQERMERYWSLRWLQQEHVQRIEATVVRGDLLRIAGLPLLNRLPGLPELPRGQRIELDVLGGDLVDLTLQARVHRVLEAALADVDVEPDAEAGSPADTPTGAPDLRADETPADGTRESG